MTRESLAQSEVVYRALIDAAPDGIVIVNQEGRIVLVNAQTEKLFGYKRAELLNQPVENSRSRRSARKTSIPSRWLHVRACSGRWAQAWNSTAFVKTARSSMWKSA